MKYGHPYPFLIFFGALVVGGLCSGGIFVTPEYLLKIFTFTFCCSLALAFVQNVTAETFNILWIALISHGILSVPALYFQYKIFKAWLYGELNTDWIQAHPEHLAQYVTGVITLMNYCNDPAIVIIGALVGPEIIIIPCYILQLYKRNVNVFSGGIAFVSCVATIVWQKFSFDNIYMLNDLVATRLQWTWFHVVFTAMIVNVCFAQVKSNSHTILDLVLSTAYAGASTVMPFIAPMSYLIIGIIPDKPLYVTTNILKVRQRLWAVALMVVSQTNYLPIISIDLEDSWAQAIIAAMYLTLALPFVPWWLLAPTALLMTNYAPKRLDVVNIEMEPLFWAILSIIGTVAPGIAFLLCLVLGNNSVSLRLLMFIIPVIIADIANLLNCYTI